MKPTASRKAGKGKTVAFLYKIMSKIGPSSAPGSSEAVVALLRKTSKKSRKRLKHSDSTDFGVQYSETTF